jgi:hypothetical protein
MSGEMEREIRSDGNLNVIQSYFFVWGSGGWGCFNSDSDFNDDQDSRHSEPREQPGDLGSRTSAATVSRLVQSANPNQ